MFCGARLAINGFAYVVMFFLKSSSQYGCEVSDSVSIFTVDESGAQSQTKSYPVFGFCSSFLFFHLLFSVATDRHEKPFAANRL